MPDRVGHGGPAAALPKQGISFVSRLNGMFAIAIYDRPSDTLYLVRDRIGVKPLYFSDRNGRLTFASEPKAILAAGGTYDIDFEALHHFLTFNYVPKPFTMFAGIRHVDPGSYLTVTRSDVSQTTWWRLADVEPEQRTEADWIDELTALLDDWVRLRMRADVPFGAFLSGGVDSSTVVALMTRHSSTAVQTFSIGFRDARYDETPFARAAAERLGTHHTVETVAPNLLGLWPKVTYHCDQPHGDVSFMPTYKLSEMAARKVKMVLTGDGPDELFAGYEKYRDFFAADLTGVSDANFRERYYRHICLSDAAKPALYGHGTDRPYDSKAIVNALFDDVGHWDRINQALYIDMQLLLSGNNLVKPDRMGMAVSLEARTPYLDYRIMELAFRMPGDLKLRNGVTKYLLKKVSEPLIGADLTHRKKQMFTVPIGDWFRDEMREYCRAHLAEGAFFRRNGTFSDKVSQLLETHIQGSQNNTREIRALLALEHWATSFGYAERAAKRR